MDNAVILAAGAGKVNLSGGWSKLWGALTAGWPQLTTVMTVIGVALVLASLVMWIWKKRKGQGDTNNVTWTILIGAILAGPALLFPLILKIVDFICNIVAKLLGIV